MNRVEYTSVECALVGLGGWRATFLTNLPLVGWKIFNPPSTHQCINHASWLKNLNGFSLVG